MNTGHHVIALPRSDLVHGAADEPDGAAQGSRRSYLTGFGLAVLLTAVPFALVIGDYLPKSIASMVVVSLAVVQIVIHMFFFLHMNSRAEGGWIMLSSIFTTVLVVIALTGSLWVMYHMDANMMPMPTPAASKAGVTPASSRPTQDLRDGQFAPQKMPGMKMD